MKKSYIVVLVVILSIFLVPIIGNKLITDRLTKEVNLLKSNGLAVKVDTTNVEYLNTKKYYEFEIKDSEKFVKYLNLDTKDSFNGTSIALDLVYSNIPFISSLELDITLLTLPTNLENYLKRYKFNLYNELNKFLLDKKLSSHIEYNLHSNFFNGKVKDIEEIFLLKDDSTIFSVLKDAKFNGTVSKRIEFNIDKSSLLLSDKGGEFEFNIEKLNTIYNFKTKNYFNSKSDVKAVRFRFNSDSKKEVLINFSNIESSFSLDENNNSLEMKTNNSLDKLTLKSDKLSAKLEDFNYELFVKNIDKIKYEKMVKIISQLDVDSNNYKVKLEDSLWEFISSGVNIELKDGSFKNLVINNEDLKGFSISSKIDIKRDNDFRYKLNHNKLELFKNINFKTKVKISKSLFNVVAQENKLLFFAKQYSKEQNNSLVYDISLMNNKLNVNGKVF